MPAHEAEKQMLLSWKWSSESSSPEPVFLLNFLIHGKKDRKATPAFLHNLQLWLTKVFERVSPFVSLPDAFQVQVIRSYYVSTTVPIHPTVLPLVILCLESEFGGVKMNLDGADAPSKRLAEKQSEKDSLTKRLESLRVLEREKQSDHDAMVERLRKRLESRPESDYPRQLEETYLCTLLEENSSRVREFEETEALLNAKLRDVCLEIESTEEDTQFSMDTASITKPRDPKDVPDSLDLIYLSTFDATKFEFLEPFGHPDVDPYSSGEISDGSWPTSNVDEWVPIRELDCPAPAKYLLCHLHLLAHLAKPSYPGGCLDDPINISDGTYLDYQEVHDIVYSHCGDHATSKDVQVMKENVFKYMNRYLFHATEGRGEFGIKKVFADKSVEFDMKPAASLASEIAHLNFTITYQETGRRRKPSKSKQTGQDASPHEESASVTKEFVPFNEWKVSPLRNQVSRIYFRPWPHVLDCHRGYFLPVDANGQKGLNYFTGFRHSMEELASAYVSCDRKVLGEFLKLVFNNICGGSESSYQFLMQFLACIVQFPFRRQQVALVMPGGQGIGKTFLMTTIGQLLGHLFHKGNADSVARKFNSMYAGKILVFMDEHSLSKRNDYNAMKTMISDENMNTEKKFQEQRTEENFANIVMAMNPTRLFEEEGHGLDKDDRRFFVCSCCGHLSQDLKTKTRKTIQAMTADKDKKEVLAFNFLLMNVDLTDYNPVEFPITEKGKMNRQTNNETYVLSWFYQRLLEKTLLPSATSDYLTSGSETFKDGGLDRETSTDLADVWNPLKFQGDTLVCWKNFLKRNGKNYMSKDEWEWVKRHHVDGEKVDQIDIMKFSEEAMDGYWKEPFWLQIVPWDKLFRSCCSWVYSQFKYQVNQRDFSEGLKSCLPRYEKKMVKVTLGEVSRRVDVLVVPTYEAVMENFKLKHGCLIIDEDRRWSEQSDWRDPPKLKLYTSSGHVRKNFRRMATKDVMLDSWVNKVEDYFSEMIESGTDPSKFRNPWVPRPFVVMDKGGTLKDTCRRRKRLLQALVVDPSVDEKLIQDLQKEKTDLLRKVENLEHQLFLRNGAIEVLRQSLEVRKKSKPQST